MKTHLLMSILGLTVLIMSCSTTGGNDEIPMIPAPPQSLNNAPNTITIIDDEASAPATITQNKLKTESEVAENKHPRIEEDRGAGGTVNQIKVENKGSIPTYYIYPPLQQDLNLNSAPVLS